MKQDVFVKYHASNFTSVRKGHSQAYNAINVGVIRKGVCMQNIKSLSLYMVQKLQRRLK